MCDSDGMAWGTCDCGDAATGTGTSTNVDAPTSTGTGTANATDSGVPGTVDASDHAGTTTTGSIGGVDAADGSTTLLSGVLPQDGGTLKGSLVEITALPGSLVNDLTVTVQTISPPPGLPPGFIPSKTAFDIEVQDQASVSLPLLIKLYYGGTNLDTAANANATMAVLHYDSQYGYEPVTMLGHDTVAKYVLFDTSAFSPYVIGAIDESSLPDTGPTTSAHASVQGFSPIENGWAISNFNDTDPFPGGSPFSSGGNCLGMSAYAVWFYQNNANSLLGSYYKESTWPPTDPPPPTDNSQSPYVSVANLAAIRAHQAESQYWAVFQHYHDILSCMTPGDPCWLSPKKRSDLMKYNMTTFTTPLVLTMRGTIAGDAGVTNVGHATVLYRYDAGNFYFYDVNDAPTSRCEPYSTTCQEHSITFYNAAPDGGAFSTYGVYNDFGVITIPGWAERIAFPDITADAAQAGGAFTQSATLTISAPQAETTVPVDQRLSITGSTTLAPRAQLYAYLNGGSRIPVVTTTPSFSLPAQQAVAGRNVLILLGGSAWTTDGTWTGATLVREFYACPAGQTWNPSAQPPACECPAGQTWNPNAQPPACECPSGTTNVSQGCVCPDGSPWNAIEMTCPCGSSLVFKDLNLEKAVRSAIGKATGDIAPSDVAKLTTLDASGQGVNNLTGIECLSVLTDLDVSQPDCTGQTGWTLDLGPLKSLFHLTRLNMTHRGAVGKDLSPLVSATDLSWLTVTGCQAAGVADISPLAKLQKLAYLDLSTNVISNLSPLRDLTNLASLNLTDNQIKDVSPLSGLVNLTMLGLGNGPGQCGGPLAHSAVTDLAPLATLAKLTTLDLSCNTSLSNLAPLAALKSLSYLGLAHCHIVDVGPLLDLSSLTTLELYSNPLDCSQLANLCSLASHISFDVFSNNPFFCTISGSGNSSPATCSCRFGTSTSGYQTCDQPM